MVQTTNNLFGSESYSGMKPRVAGSSPAGRANFSGERSSVGRVQDCDSCGRGFDPRRSPHFILHFQALDQRVLRGLSSSRKLASILTSNSIQRPTNHNKSESRFT